MRGSEPTRSRFFAGGTTTPLSTAHGAYYTSGPSRPSWLKDGLGLVTDRLQRGMAERAKANYGLSVEPRLGGLA